MFLKKNNSDNSSITKYIVITAIWKTGYHLTSISHYLAVDFLVNNLKYNNFVGYGKGPICVF